MTAQQKLVEPRSIRIAGLDEIGPRDQIIEVENVAKPPFDWRMLEKACVVAACAMRSQERFDRVRWLRVILRAGRERRKP